MLVLAGGMAVTTVWYGLVGGQHRLRQPQPGLTSYPLAAMSFARVAVLVAMILTLAAVGPTFAKLEATILAARLQRIIPETEAGGDTAAEAISKASQIFSTSKSTNVKLKPELVEQYGTALAKLSGDPSLKRAALDGLDETVSYRSFLNENYIPTLADLTPWREGGGYKFGLNITQLPPNVQGAPFSVMQAGGEQPPENAARLEFLSPPQEFNRRGVGLFLVDANHIGIGLNNMYMKNVIIRNAVIYYSAGPTKLEHVYFVNCSFVLSDAPAARRLSAQLLRSAAVNFTNP
jgi:hypothetical protein